MSDNNFIIEYYEDWADYPSWAELSTDEHEESPRFATVQEGRAWLDAYLDEQDEKSWAAYYKREAEIREAWVRHEQRVAVLDAAGLLQAGPGEYRDAPLMKPSTLYAKPRGVDRRNYRVTLDDDERCPTCGSGKGRDA